MQSCKLPIEVCERVIDNLALPAHNPTILDYDKAVEAVSTLYACSLVCRDWVPRSQHHLIRCVTLRTTRGADAFLSTIARHPHRAQSVQFLGIYPRPPPSSTKPASPSPTPSDSPAPTSSTLPSHSPALPASPVAPSSSHSPQIPVSVSNDQHVEETPSQSESGNLAHVPTTESSEFHISSRDRTQDKIEGKTSIPPCYYNWIYKVLTRLLPLLVNLSSLHLHGLPTLHPLFVRLVSCSKTLRTLIFSDLENQSFSEIIQVINRLPQLRSIYFEDTKWVRPVRFFSRRSHRFKDIFCGADDEYVNTDVLDWLGSPQDLSRLRLLLINPLQRSDLNKVHHILQRCMCSLEFLNLFSSDANMFGESCPTPTASHTDRSLHVESLSLSSHLKLEYMRIITTSSNLSQNVALLSSHISQLLSPSLVYLIIGHFEDLELESLVTSPSSWKDIDNALSQPKFNRLAYFVISLSVSHEGNIDHETLRATFQTILPQSYQRGILWVEKYIEAIEGRRGEHFPE
ncbi:hypothetical protein NLI96_g10472 [Meripilus lineatus]|uniref:Uncharacterized protein n=1 Tax=Meripilus lineatus TaxID=2056292 RepID=A0AAD5UTK8_9APHY|nr:hypothetical protein NLI96_g10472 [Physisporinus lineatus]